jgi:hypothetical protein
MTLEFKPFRILPAVFLSLAKILLVAIGVFCAGATAALAAPITYSFSGTATGTLNGIAFTNAAVTVDAFGDTTAVLAGTISCNSLTSVTFSISGVGAGTVTDTLAIFDNNGNAALGL